MTEVLEETDKGQPENASEYTPEEIQQAMVEETSLTQSAVTQQLQNRNFTLNIEARRAQARVAKLEEENRILRSVIRDFEDKRPVSEDDVAKVDTTVERYLAQARAAEEQERARLDAESQPPTA